MDFGIGKAVVDILAALLKAKLVSVPPADSIRISVDRHLAEVLTWSERLQFYGMSKAEDTANNTIPLSLSDEPRRFTGTRDGGSTLTELDLVDNAGHYLLLGDPGAGKTTTLKRIARRLLLEEPSSVGDVYAFPIVVICRELSRRSSLTLGIAKTLGIPVSNRPARSTDTNDDHEDYWCGDEPLQKVVAEFVDNSQAAVLIDGLDETPAEIRRHVDHEVSWLSRNCRRGKIIASTRTGDYTQVYDGLDLVELCPLDDQQIAAIAERWVHNPRAFLSRLAELPYHDVVDRPLLLTQLLFLFKRYGDLPEQPADIYKTIVELLLREWDAERGILRTSRYAGFNPRRKSEFLWAIAYQLTYKIKKKAFSVAELERAYIGVHDRFGLPADEASEVVAELETHTGIITAAGMSTFEFSHLSLQEYLCAEYLVREPFAQHLINYLTEYPSPLAIAVTLSSNPSAWFAALVLRSPSTWPSESMNSFLSRLILERPFFTTSEPLGVAIMKLYGDAVDAGHLVMEALDRIAMSPAGQSSISLALTYFQAASDPRPRFKSLAAIDRREGVVPGREFSIPPRVYLPKRLLQHLIDNGSGAAAALGRAGP